MKAKICLCARLLLLHLCWIVPVLMLAANVLSWLRYGTDFPFYDDWRAYAAGDIGSFRLAHLFQVVNNTMSPVGFTLDALAQRWLDGNAVAYQLLSMLVVLGGLLWLQWKLLEWAVASPSVRAVAFAFTIFMLQPATYWGEQNLAYHQALPLFFLLAALYASLISKLQLKVLFGTVALLGLLAGLSYISGAVAAMVMGGILWLRAYFALRSRKERSDAPAAALHKKIAVRASCGGMALLLTGAVTSAFQFYATRLSGNSDHSETAPVRWPIQPDFWAYLLGKVGRSFGSAFRGAGAELAFALALAAMLLVVFLVFVKRMAERGGEPGEALDAVHGTASLSRLSCVYLPITGAVVVYLGLVSFGRAGYRDASIQSFSDVFLFAYQRFHFFWITLLFPWAVAAALLLMQRIGKHQRAGVCIAAGFMLALGWGFAGARGVFDVSAYYEQGARARAGTIRCVREQLGSGGPIMCPELALPGWTDWTPAFVYARQIGASFTKYLPVAGQESPRQWLFQGRPEGQAGVSWHDADAVGGGWRQGRADPQLLIESAQAESYARCRVLMVRLVLRSAQASSAQVFYRPSGAQGFSADWSSTRPVVVGTEAPVELNFALESANGFAPALRIDPVQSDARFLVDDVRVGCGLQRP
ncbi:MAG: hypothetical protein WBC18_27070 [Ottowia sp.]|uniref:hypothetical protein n=1 Tax=Ottowia sp. TaxID=1898956 RepID=UPI003C746B0F